MPQYELHVRYIIEADSESAARQAWIDNGLGDEGKLLAVDEHRPLCAHDDDPEECWPCAADRDYGPRAGRFAAAFTSLEGAATPIEDLAELQQFLLVERNERGSDPAYYLTTFTTAAEAIEYHFNQEYAEDWGLVDLIDLDTGEGYDVQVEQTYKFTKRAEVEL